MKIPIPNVGSEEWRKQTALMRAKIKPGMTVTFLTGHEGYRRISSRTGQTATVIRASEDKTYVADVKAQDGAIISVLFSEIKLDLHDPFRTMVMNETICTHNSL